MQVTVFIDSFANPANPAATCGNCTYYTFSISLLDLFFY